MVRPSPANRPKPLSVNVVLDPPARQTVSRPSKNYIAGDKPYGNLFIPGRIFHTSDTTPKGVGLLHRAREPGPICPGAVIELTLSIHWQGELQSRSSDGALRCGRHQ